MDSKLSQKVIPFLIVEQNIPAIQDNEQSNIYVIDEDISQITFQALLVDIEAEDELNNLIITNSKRISPSLELRRSLDSQKSIHLWRTSDIYKRDKEYSMHYQVSFQYVQHIDRIQIWEYQTKVSFDQKHLSDFAAFDASKVALVEKLVSSLKTCYYHERNKMAELEIER